MSDRNLSSHFSSQQRQLAASCSGDVLAPQGLPACFLLKPRLCACGRRRQRSVCSAVFALQAIPCSLPSVHSQTHTQKLCEACPELHVRWSSWWVTCWVLALRPREGTGCTASLRLVPIPHRSLCSGMNSCHTRLPQPSLLYLAAAHSVCRLDGKDLSLGLALCPGVHLTGLTRPGGHLASFGTEGMGWGQCVGQDASCCWEAG